MGIRAVLDSVIWFLDTTDKMMSDQVDKTTSSFKQQIIRQCSLFVKVTVELRAVGVMRYMWYNQPLGNR